MHVVDDRTTDALRAHLVRRARASCSLVISARGGRADATWREIGERLGVSNVERSPASCAAQLASATHGRRTAVLLSLPASGSWDRAITAELSQPQYDGRVPLVIVLVPSIDPVRDVRGEVYEVSPSLDEADKRRWIATLAADALASLKHDDLVGLESWWSAAKHVAPRAAIAEVPVEARSLFVALSLSGRGWHEHDLPLLGGSAGALRALEVSGLVQNERGFFALTPAAEPLEASVASLETAAVCARIGRALEHRFPGDAWAHARGAELYLRSGAADLADEAYGRALGAADDALVRREVVASWMRALDADRSEARLSLRMRAAERALESGEADEAYRWAKAAASLTHGENIDVTLLVGRAAVAMGDLVTARVALERGRAAVKDAAVQARIAADLAEVAYAKGETRLAADEARRALATNDVPTRLRARNTLGKLLLADARWEEAEHHFTEDAHVASAAGDRTSELRARVNRAVALLSRGQLEEAERIFAAVLEEGERIGDNRASAFALDNLAVVATWRHEYGEALMLSERTLQKRLRIGDRLSTAFILSNLAEIRGKVGLLDYAEHAVSFGRRLLGPGMPPTLSVRFSVHAARLALLRGRTLDAQREVGKALTEQATAESGELAGRAHRIAARIALEDGDVARALSAIRPLARARDDGLRAGRGRGARGRARPREGRARRRARRPRREPRPRDGRRRDPARGPPPRRQGLRRERRGRARARPHRSGAGCPRRGRPHPRRRRPRCVPRTPRRRRPRSGGRRAPSARVASEQSRARSRRPAHAAQPRSGPGADDRRRRPCDPRPPPRRSARSRAPTAPSSSAARAAPARSSSPRRSTARASAPRGPFVSAQLRGARRDAPPLRALRPREGRVHRRRRAPPRPLRAGRGRHALPRRDRRHLAAHAGRAPARPAGADVRARRRHDGDPRQRPRRLRDPPRPRARWSSAASSARTSTTASAASRSRCPPSARASATCRASPSTCSVASPPSAARRRRRSRRRARSPRRATGGRATCASSKRAPRRRRSSRSRTSSPPQTSSTTSTSSAPPRTRHLVRAARPCRSSATRRTTRARRSRRRGRRRAVPASLRDEAERDRGRLRACVRQGSVSLSDHQTSNRARLRRARSGGDHGEHHASRSAPRDEAPAALSARQAVRSRPPSPRSPSHEGRKQAPPRQTAVPRGSGHGLHRPGRTGNGRPRLERPGADPDRCDIGRFPARKAVRAGHRAATSTPRAASPPRPFSERARTSRASTSRTRADPGGPVIGRRRRPRARPASLAHAHDRARTLKLNRRLATRESFCHRPVPPAH